MVFAIVPTKRVYPSGGAVATERAAILLLAPARLSTINCWPRVCPSLCASTRAATSVALPAGNPTIIFTGLDGKRPLLGLKMARLALQLPIVRGEIDFFVAFLGPSVVGVC